MAERKVVNKFYPPDFNPAKIPRKRTPKNRQTNVRTMLPMSIRCRTCGSYISKGTKCNSRKEEAMGETYLGLKIYRFYLKCTTCSAEITMKTDSQNSDYTVESGATRNFEPWRAEDKVVEKKQRKRDAEEMGDAMKSLENRTLVSKREMDNLSALDEVKSMKSRRAHVSVDSMLEALQRSAPVQQKEGFEEEDEALIKSIFQGSREFVRVIDDEELDNDDGDDDDITKKRKVSHEDSDKPMDYLTKTSTIDKLHKKEEADGSSSGRIFLKSSTIKFNVAKKPSKGITQEEKKSKKSDGLESLCQYDSSDEED